MRKISKGYRKAALVFVIWAVLDFLTYIIPVTPEVMGAFGLYDLIPYLQYLPMVAVVKAILGAVILGVGAIRARIGRKVRSLTVITWMLVLSLFSVWAVGMYCLTSVTAENVTARVRLAYSSYATRVSEWVHAGLENVGDPEKNYRFMDAVAMGSRLTWSTGYADGNEETGFLAFPNADIVHFATALFDNTGKMLISGADNYFYYLYADEQEWEYPGKGETGVARTCFDPEKLTKTGKEILDNTRWLWNEAVVTRFVGYYDGTVLVPQKIEYIDHSQYRSAGYYDYDHMSKVARAVRASKMNWRTLYEDPDITLPDQEKVILYSLRPEVCYHPDMPSFTYDGVEYASAADFLAEKGRDLMVGGTNGRVFHDRKLILVSASFRIIRDGEMQNNFNWPQVQQPEDELQYYFVSVVYCDPWASAAAGLKNVYIATFGLAVAMVLFIRHMIKRHLILPLREAGDALDGIERNIAYELESSNEWYEGQLISNGWKKTRREIQQQRNEITRLNTALEYARTAEENRRQMTSNIAHELKTPLAIIHSYAEGLKEHIAEEKRDKYIDVILSETQRTDAMVLQMLDLSRLEAGKVKLSQDRFSLSAMTRSIFERLELAASAKELKIEFDFPEEFEIVADESRMAQVVENLATNAVKYTPIGGNIRVEAYRGRKGTVFSIENDSEPLSPEALSKVWEVFYRADEARSGGGTGLGLAITKTIVELHGGKCSVQNTKTGVKFGFTI